MKDRNRLQAEIMLANSLLAEIEIKEQELKRLAFRVKYGRHPGGEDSLEIPYKKILREELGIVI